MNCINVEPRVCMLRHAWHKRHEPKSFCAQCALSPEVITPKPPAKKKAQRLKSVRQQVQPGDLARLIGHVLPEAEACALGIGYLASLCGASSDQVEQILVASDMTVFKADIEFKGQIQRGLSVNKKLKKWVSAYMLEEEAA